ncbi:hypothetical protein C8Q78DRAFT_1008016 [Trametes maxima]|nr:hypothetical protein C8Q78DRAFT_1008016 [Trametes maxima]
MCCTGCGVTRCDATRRGGRIPRTGSDETTAGRVRNHKDPGRGADHEKHDGVRGRAPSAGRRCVIGPVDGRPRGGHWARARECAQGTRTAADAACAAGGRLETLDEAAGDVKGVVERISI